LCGENFRYEAIKSEANLAAWRPRNGAMVLISQLIVPLVERVSQRVQNSNR